MPHLPRRSSRGLLIALLLLAVVFILTITRDRPPAAKPADAPPTQFSAARAREILRRLVGDNVPHPVGSAADAVVRDKIVKILTDLGYQPEVHSGFACDEWGACAAVKNVVARVDGSDIPGAVLLSAHYDSVPAGPGASDDGAGTVEVLEIARVLKAHTPLRHPVIILLNEGEEAGLLGAKAFVESDPWAHDVKAAVNLDNRGTSGPAVMFETGDANDWAVRVYDAAMSRPSSNSITYLAYKLLPNDTDFTVYKAAGYQGLNFAFIDSVKNYHTPHDNYENADPRSIQSEGDNGLASVLALGDEVLTNPPPGEAVYFDVFGWLMVRWKAARSFPASIAIAVLLLLEIFIVMKKFGVHAKEIVLGKIGWVASVVIAGGLGYLLFVLLRAAHRIPPGSAEYPWIAHPLPAQIAFFALGFVAAGITALLAAKRAGFWGFWIANNAVICFFAIIAAKYATGACYPFLVPSLGAVVAAIPALVTQEDSTGNREFAAILPAALTFVVFVPMLWQLYDALGAGFLPIIAALFAVALASILPLLALDDDRERRAFAEDSAGVALVAAIVAFFMAPYTLASPQIMNVEYWFDADAHAAKWLATPDSLRLPASLAAAAPFTNKPEAIFPWNRAHVFWADAPDLKFPAPELAVISAEPSGGTIHYAVRVFSPRGAPDISVLFPPETNVRNLAAEGHSIPEPAGRVREYIEGSMHGWRFCEFPAVTAEGITMTFDLEATSPVIYIVDRSYALPPEARPLLDAVPPDTVTSQDGNVTFVSRKLQLGVAGASQLPKN
jgi:hypothetical protein